MKLNERFFYTLRWTLPLIAALALVGPTPAEASRPATDHESLRFELALRGQGCDLYEPGACHYHFRVSTVNPRWAAATILAQSGHPEVQEAREALYHGKGAWRLFHHGLPCDVPKKIRHDLHLRCL